MDIIKKVKAICTQEKRHKKKQEELLSELCRLINKMNINAACARLQLTDINKYTKDDDDPKYTKWWTDARIDMAVTSLYKEKDYYMEAINVMQALFNEYIDHWG